MSTPDEVFFSENIKNFYSSHLRDFGNSAKGVGWKNTDAQHIRFEQLIKIITKPDYTINDLGCGVGELYTFLKERQRVPREYYGYDILKDMVDTANELLGEAPMRLTIQSPVEYSTLSMKPLNHSGCSMF